MKRSDLAAFAIAGGILLMMVWIVAGTKIAFLTLFGAGVAYGLGRVVKRLI